MSEKKKKQGIPVGTIPFVLLWTLSYGLGWGGAYSIAFVFDYISPNVLNQLPGMAILILGSAIPAFISSLIQQFLIRWKFGVSFKRWWLWNVLSAVVIGVGVFSFFETNAVQLIYPITNYLNQVNEMLVPVIGFGILFALYSTFQALMLRHHVRRVWLWSLAAFVSAATFVLSLFNLATYSSNLWFVTGLSIAGLAQGSVMALTLVWLFGMTRAEAVAQAYDTTRLQAKNKHDDENLQDAESPADAILVELEKRQAMESES